jgi:hypothetical protein
MPEIGTVATEEDDGEQTATAVAPEPAVRPRGGGRPGRPGGHARPTS